MASENPLQAYMEKKAGFGQAVGQAAKATFSPQNIANHAVGAAGAALGAGALAGIGAGAHMLYDAATKSRDFKAMLAENEDVAQMHAENPREVNRMFSSLRTFAPEFTSDPTVAGAYMRQMVGNPNGVAGIMGQALDSRRKMLGNKPAQHGFGESVMMGANKGGPANPLGPREDAYAEKKMTWQESEAGAGRFGGGSKQRKSHEE